MFVAGIELFFGLLVGFFIWRLACAALKITWACLRLYWEWWNRKAISRVSTPH